MARTQKKNRTSEETKVADAKTLDGGNGSEPPAAPARPRVSPFKFLQQVRQETSKVTWPTRKETTITTVMVFVMVVLSALFFLAIDAVLGTAVRYALQALS